MKKDTSWIIKYVDFMRAEDYENAFTLKNSNIPESLFKYRPLNDFTLENLESDTVWLADINTLNDPFESQLLFNYHESIRSFFKSEHFIDRFKSKFNLALSDLELTSIIQSENPFNTYCTICKSKGIILNKHEEEQVDRIQESWRLMTEENKRLIRICSLSERNDSLLMWSHYALQHQGICIEYNYNNFDKYRPFLQPVNYSEELFKVDSIDELKTINILMASIYKSKEWEYENEWRLTTLPQHQINNNNLEAPIPKAIYLGTRFNLNSSFKTKQLLRISKSKGIPVFQMKIHPHEYKIIKDFEVKL